MRPPSPRAQAAEPARRNRHGAAGDIGGLIAAERLRLHGQEIFDVSDRRVKLTELLLRVVRDDGSLGNPVDLIARAEVLGVIGEIDRWVLAQAVPLAAMGAVLSVNVSGCTLEDPAFAESVQRLLALHGTEPWRLTFEITETAAVRDFGEVCRQTQRLTALGCGLALDDFGTGYGTMTYLKELPASYLKIDREFVSDAVANPRSREVIAGVVALAERFGQKTIAEGVECAETLDLLRSLGVSYAQGFHLAMPHPICEPRTDASRPPEDSAELRC